MTRLSFRRTTRPRQPLLPLLPNEPRLLQSAREKALTTRFLQPAWADLERLFVWLRGELDGPLREQRPDKLGKPYPLGQCLEISQAMEKRLARLNGEALAGSEDEPGYRALRAFIDHGGTLRQVWGDLRGQYFQNAFLLGDCYLDVANDTVDAAKPPVELLPFAESGLVPIRDYAHFTRVAERYWQARVLPNHLLPELAPYFPLVVIQPGGRAQLHGLFDYLISLTCRGAFQPSEAALKAPPLDAAVFTRLREGVDPALTLPASPRDGREQALAACRRARKAGRHQDVAARNAAVKSALAVNGQLARLQVLPS